MSPEPGNCTGNVGGQEGFQHCPQTGTMKVLAASALSVGRQALQAQGADAATLG